MSGGDRFRGKLSPQQLDIVIRLVGFRSKRVKKYLPMYFVQGIIVADIAGYTGFDISNIHRDVTKVARVLNFVELYNEYERLK
mgnify:FL=1